MKQSEIQELIKFVAKAGVTEVEIENKDFKITIKSEMPKKKGLAEPVIQQIQVPVAQPQVVAPAPVAAPAPAAAPAPTAETPEAEDNSNLIEVKSPMIGTFYRRPSPDKDHSKTLETLSKREMWYALLRL